MMKAHERSTDSNRAAARIGVIVLAAGASTRMGQPKQLLVHRGRSLVRGAAETALESQCRPVVIVTGANGASVANELSDLPVTVAENSSWAEGMSSSIRCGLEGVAAEGNPAAVVIMLCDQPFVTAPVIDRLGHTYRETGMPIVASAYGSTLGVPALFDRSLFAELAALSGSEGARKVIARHPDDVAAVPFPGGAFDLDTPRDYQRLEKFASSILTAR